MGAGGKEDGAWVGRLNVTKRNRESKLQFEALSLGEVKKMALSKSRKVSLEYLDHQIGHILS